MLIKQPQVNIVFRDVVLATGEKARAYFAVIVSEGVRDVRFLGVKTLSDVEASAQSVEVALLEAPKKASFWSELFIPSIFQAVSPFYTLDFLVNQLARAPSAR